ncbi:hypothetical protein ACN4FR_04335 [Aliarcobacter butzleri]|uniref:hypothetical protein n=2 Tax=Aliarcobacter butzleri TaxID=28197 RepID=UPI003AF33470
MQKIIKEKFTNLLEKEKNYNPFNELINYGFCFKCFINQDEDFNITMKLINDNIEYFDKKFINIFKNNLLNELKIIKNKIESIENIEEKINEEKFHKYKITLIEKKLDISSLKEYIDKYSYCLLGEICLTWNKDYPEVMNENYIKIYEPLYSIVEILFKDYKSKSTPFINFEEIENTKKQLIDIYSPANYIDKYNLLKFSKSHNLYVSYKEVSHIVDSEKQKYFYSDYISTIIFEVIKDLMEKKYLNDISFLVTYIRNDCVMLEEKEYGRLFSYDLKELPNISCFYDENLSDNKLIIKKQIEDSKISLTFETLKDDFISQEEQIITNLIHLEIETINNEEFITHLDHEFILYKLDEYEDKINSYSKKGSKKIKTFKIDNSQIPLKYNYKGTPILIHFIMEFLDNKELIAEYFSKIYKR